MTNTNYPYTAGDYIFHKFKPTELLIEKETFYSSEKKHFSDEIEFIVILDGIGQVEINNHISSVEKGMLIQLMPYHVNRMIIPPKQSIAFYRIRFSIGLFLLINIDKSRYLQTIDQIDQMSPILALDEESF